MSNPNPPPQLRLDGNLYPKKTDSSGASSSGSSGSFEITTYFQLSNKLPFFEDFTSAIMHSDVSPLGRSVYVNEFGRDAKTSAVPRGAYATYIETSKLYVPSWTRLNETQRFVAKIHLYRNPIAGQTATLNIIPEISWNTPFTNGNENIDLHTTTTANPNTAGSHLNKIIYPGWYDWSGGNSGEGIVSTPASTSGWLAIDYTKGLSQIHYDKSYRTHGTESYNDTVWLRLRDANSPHNILSSSWQTSRDTTGKYLYIGDTANNNLCRFYDFTGKYPPYGTYKTSLFNNFDLWSPPENSNLFEISGDITGNVYIDTNPILDNISQGTTYLGSPDHYSRMWMKIRLPVHLNGLILLSLLELRISTALDSNKILAASPYVADTTAWTSASSWATMESIYDSLYPTICRNYHQFNQGAINTVNNPYYFYFHATPRWADHGVSADVPDITVPYLTYRHLLNGDTSAACTIMLREFNSPTQTLENTSNITTNQFKLGTSGTFITPAPSQKTFTLTGANKPRMIYMYIGPKIRVTPSVFNITTPAGVNPPNSSVSVSNVGYGLINISYTADNAWAIPSVSTGGDLVNDTSEIVTISYNVDGMAPGSYTTIVRATNPDADPTSQVATINLTITNNAFLVRTPSSFSWTMLRGATLPTGTLTVYDGNAASEDNISYNITTNQSWLNVSPSSGSSDSSSNSVNHTVSFDPEVALFPPGTYTGTITMTSTNGTGSAVTTVTLQISEKIKPAPAYGSYIL